MNDKPDLKEREEAWKENVKGSFTDLLDLFIDISDRAASNVNYIHPVKQKFEDHTEYDETKAVAVQVTFLLRFEEPIDVPTENE